MRPLTRKLSLFNLLHSRFLLTARTPPLAVSSSTKTTFTPPIHLSTYLTPNHYTRRRETYAPPSAMDGDTTHSSELEPPSIADEFVHVHSARANSTSEDSDQSVVSFDEERGNDVSRAGEGGSEQRRVLPEELPRSVMKLTCESSAPGGFCDVYVVGTAHVSKDSCQEVQAVVSCLKPEVVFLELCAGRVAVLNPQKLKVPTMREMVDIWKKENDLLGILYSWFVTKVASKLEVFPGSEFRVAYEEAMKYGGKVILGDRPVDITLKRTWGKMPLWHKTKLLFSLLFQSFFLPSAASLNRMMKEMDDVDMLTLVVQEMSRTYPTLMETLVHERDKYMSSKLLRVARQHSSVVAVVGKGHLVGIKKHWQQPIEINELLEMPTKKPIISIVKVVSAVGVTVVGVAIVSGIYLYTRK